jgi:hypothetical protein
LRRNSSIWKVPPEKFRFEVGLRSRNWTSGVSSSPNRSRSNALVQVEEARDVVVVCG